MSPANIRTIFESAWYEKHPETLVQLGGSLDEWQEIFAEAKRLLQAGEVLNHEHNHERLRVVLALRQKYGLDLGSAAAVSTGSGAQLLHRLAYMRDLHGVPDVYRVWDR